jgi:Lon protease-like protein
MQSTLPEVLPIIPLPGAILLPGSQMPINIFEPVYRALIDENLNWPRMVGIIQPIMDGGRPFLELQPVGAAARIVGFSERGDGRYEVHLLGLARFRVSAEADRAQAGYRRIVPDWGAYSSDLSSPPRPRYNRERLEQALYLYLSARYPFDTQVFQDISDSRLVDSFSMACPFEPDERQMLLEAADINDRASLLVELLEISGADKGI